MPLEISWFAPSCWGDTARLGVDDPNILSGYPLDDEAARVAELLLPRFEVGPLDFPPA